MSRILAHGLCRSLELCIALGVVAAAVQLSRLIQ
jgi:hypothetical protein